MGCVIVDATLSERTSPRDRFDLGALPWLRSAYREGKKIGHLGHLNFSLRSLASTAGIYSLVIANRQGKLNVDPDPTWLVTQILPPCSSTNLRQRANPSPVSSCFAALGPDLEIHHERRGWLDAHGVILRIRIRRSNDPRHVRQDPLGCARLRLLEHARRREDSFALAVEAVAGRRGVERGLADQRCLCSERRTGVLGVEQPGGIQEKRLLPHQHDDAGGVRSRHAGPEQAGCAPAQLGR